MKRASLLMLIAAVPFLPAEAQTCSDTACNFYNSWLQSDTTSTGEALAATIAAINAAVGMTSDQQDINTSILNHASPIAIANANDLVYSTLLGKPYYATDPRGPSAAANAPYQYALNASGANRAHVAPSDQWAGSGADKERYASYYATVVAAQSFSAYVLTNYALNDTATLDPALKRLFTELNGDAAAATASESLGPLLRQLVLTERENLVLLSQLVQTGKQLLVAQAITNALLAANSPVEAQLLQKAIGAASSSTGGHTPQP
jgi:hypothetical protein